MGSSLAGITDSVRVPASDQLPQRGLSVSDSFPALAIGDSGTPVSLSGVPLLAKSISPVPVLVETVTGVLVNNVSFLLKIFPGVLVNIIRVLLKTIIHCSDLLPRQHLRFGVMQQLSRHCLFPGLSLPFRLVDRLVHGRSLQRFHVRGSFLEQRRYGDGNSGHGRVAVGVRGDGVGSSGVRVVVKIRSDLLAGLLVLTGLQENGEFVCEFGVQASLDDSATAAGFGVVALSVMADEWHLRKIIHLSLM